jgi:acetyl esterase
VGIVKAAASARLVGALATVFLPIATAAADVPEQVIALRQTLETAAQMQAAAPAQVASVEDRTVALPVGGHDAVLHLRFYRNRSATPQPAVLLLHGGGWIAGSLATHDQIARILAAESGAAIIALDYSRSPEARYPQALNEAFAALRWITREAASLGLDATRIAVLGDSSGGNLAAALTLLARDRNGPAIAAQVLINPVLDLARLDTASYRRVGSEAMAFYRAQYLRPRDDPENPYVSPLRAPDLSGLPPALIVVAGRDALEDEDEAYVERLRLAKVQADRLHVPDEPHFGMRWATGDARLRGAIETTVQFLRQRLQ